MFLVLLLTQAFFGSIMQGSQAFGHDSFFFPPWDETKAEVGQTKGNGGILTFFSSNCLFSSFFLILLNPYNKGSVSTS